MQVCPAPSISVETETSTEQTDTEIIDFSYFSASIGLCYVQNRTSLEPNKPNRTVGLNRLPTPIDAINDHMVLIKQQNDHIAKLDAKIAEHELENEKFKFARNMLYSGRRPGIKDDIGFQKGDNVKLNAPPKKLSNFIKGKAPMPQDNEGYILYPAGYPKRKIRRIHSRKSHSGPNHAFMYKGETSSSRQPTCAKLPKKKTPSASNDHDISFKTFDASYVLTNKSGKVVAKYVGGKHKGSKTCVWVPKVLVSNAKGPKTIWVPKVKN
jgi:hypothetical protein